MVSKNYKYIIYRLSEVSGCRREGTIITYVSKYRTYGWIPERYSRQSLIHRLALEVYYKDRKIFDNLSTDMSEVRPEYNIGDSGLGFGTSKYIHKYAIAYESLSGIKIIDPMVFEKEVADKVKVIAARDEKRKAEYRARRRTERYTFRRGPVPGIFGTRCHIGTYYRHARMAGIRRQNAEIEYAEYLKPKHREKNLPVWDDNVRYNDKSWKTQCKERKQYMKHSRKHVSRGTKEMTWLDELDIVEKELIAESAEEIA